MIDRAKILEELREIAKERGGHCLANEYINSTSKLLFECKHRHQFESCRDYLKAGNWCPFCAGRGRTIADLQELAAQYGGRCLSPTFLGMGKKHLWECAEGHKWEAIPQNIKTLGRWCPDCGRAKSDKNRRRYTLEDMQNLAQLRSGLCLSSHFESVVKKLTWQCAEGHIWEATPHNIKNDGWCPKCAQKIRGEKRKTHTIEKMQVFATSKGGRCLSQVFINVKESLLWQCAEGHQWEANADNIINGGKWCPDCAGNNKKTIEDMQRLAAERGGKCLSTIYQGTNTKLLWECQEGHRWQTIPSIIVREGWCPDCSAGLGERICRAFFEQLFGYPFNKTRPEWLRSADGHQMELDGYSPSLKLAFEHQGLQHYKHIKYFHSSDAKLLKIQNRDQRKRDLCKAHGVTLIEIPSILDVLGIDSIKFFIRDELLKKGIPLPSGFDEKKVDLQAVYCPNRLGELQAIATKHGGKLISKQYLGIFEHLEWECAKGHRFKAAPNNVKNSGSWCPKCLGKDKTIQDMQAFAAERSGKCLSEEYINSVTPLLWECKEGHQWKARPSNVFFGTWCPECAKKERGLKRRTHTIEEMHQIAIVRNGKCLSSDYKGTKQKLLWECEKGHKWEATPESILRGGTWCPRCAKHKRTRPLQ
ncbi:hypothetical protein NDI37_25845 [Funiculus sociatus GB2-A5]|uniref:Zinc-ribbon domain-containing protein n=1 Tax=Funiculus sociatus GB2-A5 TaxID=2933946 RepID=A0ABV0JWR7_9CYAN|nr:MULTISPECIES: hypothetical protein [unclassified Trichocoleus]MBD1904049.1 hypothetical protein [Trichocoleus sp. FACHB-832]MBD2062184.1 hypothetical protein [Trichocoleus sp. FACHB-6]